MVRSGGAVLAAHDVHGNELDMFCGALFGQGDPHPGSDLRTLLDPAVCADAGVGADPGTGLDLHAFGERDALADVCRAGHVGRLRGRLGRRQTCNC